MKHTINGKTGLILCKKAVLYGFTIYGKKYKINAIIPKSQSIQKTREVYRKYCRFGIDDTFPEYLDGLRYISDIDLLCEII